MKCGCMWPRKRIHDGSGMRLTRYRGKRLACVFGRRKDTVFLELQGLLAPLVSHGFTRMGKVPTTASHA